MGPSLERWWYPIGLGWPSNQMELAFSRCLFILQWPNPLSKTELNMKSANLKLRVKNRIVRWWSGGVSRSFRDPENEMNSIVCGFDYQKAKDYPISYRSKYYKTKFGTRFWNYYWDIIITAWCAWSDCKDFRFKGFLFMRQNVDESIITSQRCQASWSNVN